MAAAWEFTIISETAIPLETLVQISREYEYAVKVESVFCISDWEWSKQEKLADARKMEKELENGKIIVVEMRSKSWKSLGLYIEKNEVYIYTFWINTEGFPELDADRITAENKSYYKHAYHILGSLIQKYSFPFQYIAIGLESDIQYSSDIKEMISHSYGVIIWMDRDSINKNQTKTQENVQ